MARRALASFQGKTSDEYYTLYEDIEKEVKNYKEELKGKIVYCNCDGKESKFIQYFKDNYDYFELSGLYATGYKEGGKGYYFYYDGEKEEEKVLNGDGSFSSQESIDILKQADIIITNPPFSKFHPFLRLLFQYEKKFLIVGTQLKVNQGNYSKMQLGYNDVNDFDTPSGRKRLCNGVWWQNIKTDIPRRKLMLTKTYEEGNYKKALNVDCILIDRIKDIPGDYPGVMAVPITIFRYDIKDYEIIELIGGGGWKYKSITRTFERPIQNTSGKPEKKVNFQINFLVDVKDLKPDDTYYTDGDLTFKTCFSKVLIKKKNNDSKN